MSLTITDLFCGAGGSGLGASAAGFRLVMAANHWTKAIETHSANFPDTEHDCADISQVDPRRYPATDVLWASPECTNHSQAKGVARSLQNQPDLFGEVLPDAAAERSRATMWDVPRFAERHAYRAVIVENVAEAAKWVMFPAWLQAMQLLGFEHQIVSLNSMHAPAINAPRAPQSRDRIYIVFHRKGNRKPKVIPTPAAWCVQCDVEVAAQQAWKNGRTVGKYRQQYVYICPRGHQVEPYALPAASAIDWTLPGTRIGDRDKPLSPKTLARIEAGLRKFGRPMTFEAAGNTFVRMDENGVPRYVRGWPVDEPTRALTTSETRALVVPLEGYDGKQARPVTEAFRTQTARHQDALVVPYYRTGVAQPASVPLSTVTTVDRSALLVPAGGSWNEDAYLADQPMRARTTTESEGVAFVATLRGYRPGNDDAMLQSTREPLSAVAAGGNHHMLVRHNGSRGDGGEMCTRASEPMRTLTSAGHQSVVGLAQQVQDASFRMLEPHEIQAAMAFTADYRVLGNRREKVRQLGNGVTPPAAEFLCGAVRDSLDVA